MLLLYYNFGGKKSAGRNKVKFQLGWKSDLFYSKFYLNLSPPIPTVWNFASKELEAAVEVLFAWRRVADTF